MKPTDCDSTANTQSTGCIVHDSPDHSPVPELSRMWRFKVAYVVSVGEVLLFSTLRQPLLIGYWVGWGTLIFGLWVQWYWITGETFGFYRKTKQYRRPGQGWRYECGFVAGRDGLKWDEIDITNQNDPDFFRGYQDGLCYASIRAADGRPPMRSNTAKPKRQPPLVDVSPRVASGNISRTRALLAIVLGIAIVLTLIVAASHFLAGNARRQKWPSSFSLGGFGKATFAADREFRQGMTKEFRTSGDGKARGLKLRMKYPASWQGIEGERPHVVQRFRATRGPPTESVGLVVRELPSSVVHFAEEDVLDELIGNEPYPGAKVVDSGHVILAGHHAQWREFDVSVNRVGIELDMHTVIFALIHRSKVVLIHCDTCAFVAKNGIGKNEPVSARERFSSVSPLFQQMLNTFDLWDRYDD